MNTLLVALIIATLAVTYISKCTAATSETLCDEEEKQSLLRFKSGLVDESNRLASWVGGENCCDWSGVVCHNLTGHVLELHLGGNATYPEANDAYYVSEDDLAAYERSCLRGKIGNSLLKLRHLSHLDLSNNDFSGIQIPEFFGSVRSLTHLNLSCGGFGGTVPPHLGNLSNLVYLNIGADDRYSLSAENMQWLSGLSSLTYINLNGIDLSNGFDWLRLMSTLSSLKELHLRLCSLADVPRPRHMNSSKVEILDVSSNPGISSFLFLEMFDSLISLDYSYNSIDGPLPRILQNLTSLIDLDLSDTGLNSSLPHWLSNLSRLEKLVLVGNQDLQVGSDGFRNLTSLRHLDLSQTSIQLKGKGPLTALCNLQWVDLSSSLHKLELTDVLGFLGCSSSRLQHLSISGSQLSGPIPELIGSLTSLTYLDLSDNQLCGMIPTSIGQMTQLEYLNLDGNSQEGTVSEAFFSDLTRLEVLVASNNSISFRVGSSWIPPFQLTTLTLSSWKLGPKFPEWLRSQHRLSYLDLAGAGIKDRVPTWFWNQSSQFLFVDLSGNNLYGEISGSIVFAQYLDLSSNNFEGLLPFVSTRVRSLDLSENLFSGPLSQLLCYKKDEPKELLVMNLGDNQLSGSIPDCWMSWPELRFVELQNNNLSGRIPDSIGSLVFLDALQLSNNSLSGFVPRSFQNSSMYILDLSQNLMSGPISQLLCNLHIQFLLLGHNQFSGNIQNCWGDSPMLERLELQHNKLSGPLPDSIGSSSFLARLHLQNNFFSGALPRSLQNCTALEFLDIGENNFCGRLPEWIGESLIDMKIVRLRSNNLEGIIPFELCALQRLQILDIANNNLSGHIPSCIVNFSAMANGRGTESFLGSDYLGTIYTEQPSENQFSQSYSGGKSTKETANLVIKGSSREYTSILQYAIFLDLSNNSLSGKIPEEIRNLAALISLNLSRNMLSGMIPKKMGSMTSLESLDLSFNRLSGEIPQSMAAMTALSFLNLSYNNLTGTIPTSTQFSTFGPSSFLGNNLTVATLAAGTNNSNSNSKRSNLANHDHHWVEFKELYVSAVLGFVVGFGMVVAPLLYSRSWRLVYFRIIGNMLDRLWELVVLPIRVRFKRQI